MRASDNHCPSKKSLKIQLQGNDGSTNKSFKKIHNPDTEGLKNIPLKIQVANTEKIRLDLLMVLRNYL